MGSGAPFVLPNHIQGEWSTAVLVTYTANLGFFEKQLLPQLSQVPIRIVLADSVQLADTFERARAAGEGLGRANRTYVVSPIRHRPAAHAKLILLIGPTKGWLAVGSGNLGLEGYASPGELWHVFAYDEARSEHRGEFEMVRELIDGWLKAVDPPAREALGRAWSTASWIGTQAESVTMLRHNLKRSLVDQLADSVTSPVRTMRVHAPFYDRELSGLVALLERIPTQRLEVLTTPDTAIDGAALTLTLNGLGIPSVYRSIALKQKSESGTYLHAKWIHLVCDDREILLAGSPNLSSPALLRAGLGANIELATLRIGAPGSFERLYDPFEIRATDNVSALRFPAPDEPAEELRPDIPRLLWAKIDGSRLVLEFDRPCPTTTHFGVSGIGGAIETTGLSRDGVRVTLDLTNDDCPRVSSGCIDVLLDGVVCGTVWPYRLDALRSQFATSNASDHLRHLHELPGGDADMMERLTALEQTLIIDFQSAWRLSHPGKALPQPDRGTDEPQIRLEDIDWSRVRRTAQHKAYLPGGQDAAATPTDLQVALAAISGRLGDLGQVTRSAPPGVEELEEELGTTPENEDESADQDEQPRRLSIGTRTRMAWTRFIDRYVRAIDDQRFITELGPYAAIQNAVIFADILNQLLKDSEDRQRLVDPVRIIRGQVRLWRHLWGDGVIDGLLDAEDSSVRVFVENTVRESHLRASILEALASEAYESLVGELRQQVRQQLGRTVSLHSFDLVGSVHELSGGEPAQVDVCIDALVRILAPRDDLEKAAHTMGRPDVASGEVDWDRKALRRYDPSSGPPSIAATERVLTIHTPIQNLDHSVMKAFLARLAAAELMTDTDDDYWRIHFDGNGKSYAFWDARFRFGTTYLDGEDDDREFDTLAPEWPAWWTEAQEIVGAFGLRAAG